MAFDLKQISTTLSNYGINSFITNDTKHLNCLDKYFGLTQKKHNISALNPYGVADINVTSSMITLDYFNENCDKVTLTYMDNLKKLNKDVFNDNYQLMTQYQIEKVIAFISELVKDKIKMIETNKAYSLENITKKSLDIAQKYIFFYKYNVSCRISYERTAIYKERTLAIEIYNGKDTRNLYNRIGYISFDKNKFGDIKMEGSSFGKLSVLPYNKQTFESDIIKMINFTLS